MIELFASHSGDKRRARAETGGPVVLIWLCEKRKVNEQQFKLVSRGAREKGGAGCGPLSRGGCLGIVATADVIP